MKQVEVRSEIQTALNSRFEEIGYALRKADFEYVRKREDIRSIFRVEVHAKTDWFLITPAAFVGSATINRQFNSILGRNIQPTGSTCGFGVGNETNSNRGRYQVDSLSEIPDVAERIWSDFTQVGSPFFERINSIEDIALYMNESKGGTCPGKSVSNACLGLIAANISRKSDVTLLADTYYQFWANAQSPGLAQDILTVRDALVGKASPTKA